MGKPDSGVGGVRPHATGLFFHLPPTPGPLCDPGATEADEPFKPWRYKLNKNREEALRSAQELRQRGFIPEIRIIRTPFTAGAEVIAKGRFTDTNNCTSVEVTWADEHLKEIDRLLSGWVGVLAIEDINKLYELRGQFLKYEDRLCRIITAQTSSGPLPPCGTSSRNLVNELRQISVKIDLPLKFNNLSLALQDWQRSKDFPKGDSNLDRFIQKVKALNKTIQQLSPKGRAARGHLMIKKFAQQNEASFEVIFRSRGEGQVVPTEIWELNWKMQGSMLPSW